MFDWGQLGFAGVIIAPLAALVFWLVRRLVTQAEANALSRIADADRRADEWRETAHVFEVALQQQRDIAQKAIETNKISDHFFDVFMKPVPKTGDNEAVGG